MSIDLDNITSGFQLSKINTNFQKVEDYINQKLLARAATGVAGEAKMARDLDMDSHNILNGMVAGIPLSEIAKQTGQVYEALANGGYGYVTVDSFEAGYTLLYPNQVLRWISTGEYYRWDGGLATFPKVVPPGSTPASTGGIGLGKWVSVGDASLRSELAGPNGYQLVPSVETQRLFYDVDSKYWGAVGDGVTDDSAAIQAAVNYCLTFDPPARLVVSGLSRLGSPVNIDRMVDAPNASTFFNITGAGRGCGFVVDSGINMFTTTLAGYNTSQKVNFENITFRASAPNFPAYVLDDAKFLRMRFTSCDFHRIKLCNATTYLQTYYLSNCTMYGWLGTFINGVNGGYDIKLVGCIAEAGDGFVSIICNDVVSPDPTAQITITSSLIQSMRKLALQFDRCQGVVISDTYFEGNGADGSPDINFATTRNLANFTANGAIKVSGCFFSQLPANYNNASYYSVVWGRIRNGFATANWLVQPGIPRTDRLHKIIPESRIVVIGDEGFVQGHFTEFLYSAGGYLQPGTGGEALRAVRGTVGPTGVINSGTGFTASRLSQGEYEVVVTSAFSGNFSPIATAADSTGGNISMLATVLSPSTVRITARNSSGVGVDTLFHFHLLGAA